MWPLCFLFFIPVASVPCDEQLKSIQIVFVIDSSLSVTPGNFRKQLQLANTVIGAVRDLYASNSGSSWEWAAIEFSGRTSVMRKMHTDGGSLDRIDESTWRTLGFGTKVKLALNTAKNLFSGDKKRFVWLLTDGKPSDISSLDEMRGFRKQWDSDQNIELTSVFLSSWGFGSKLSAQSVLQVLSCPDTGTDCDGRVLLGSTSKNAAAFAQKAKDSFRKVIVHTASQCPPPDTNPNPNPSSTTDGPSSTTDGPISTTDGSNNPSDPSTTSTSDNTLPLIGAILIALMLVACLAVVCYSTKKHQPPLETEDMVERGQPERFGVGTQKRIDDASSDQYGKLSSIYHRNRLMTKRRAYGNR